jgi:hypothetical protein
MIKFSNGLLASLLLAGVAVAQGPAPLSTAKKLSLAQSAVTRLGSKMKVSGLKSSVSLSINHGKAGDQAELALQKWIMEVNFRLGYAYLNASADIDSDHPVKVRFEVPSDGMYFVDVTLGPIPGMGTTSLFGRTTSSSQPTTRTTSILTVGDTHFGFAFQAKAKTTRYIYVGARNPWKFHKCEISKVS